MGIEQVFPYGHPDHTPPTPVDLSCLTEADPATMTLDQLELALRGLEGARCQLDAIELAMLGEYDHRDGHTRSGSITAAAELAHRHGRDRRQLRGRVSCARKLRRLPAMAAALAAGSVTAEHADVLTRALTERTQAAMTRDEPHLVRVAARLGVDEYRRAIRYWKAHADPDGTDPGGGAPSEWHLSESSDGDGFTKGHFDPVDTATLRRAIDDMLDEMHRNTTTTDNTNGDGSDGNGDGSDGNGGGGSGEGTERVPIAQRRAQAVMELIRRGAGLDTEGHPHRRTRPQVVVTINYENLCTRAGLGELDTGAAVSAATVRRLACDADLIAAVFNTDSELLDLARRTRLVTPAQRLALALRDRGCVFPGCDRPPTWCDAHHIHHWANHGPSDLTNLVLLCTRHHHLLHEGGWTLTGNPTTHSLIFTAPNGTTHHTRPPPPGHPDPHHTHPPPDPDRPGPPGDQDRDQPDQDERDNQQGSGDHSQPDQDPEDRDSQDGPGNPHGHAGQDTPLDRRDYRGPEAGSHPVDLEEPDDPDDQQPAA